MNGPRRIRVLLAVDARMRRDLLRRSLASQIDMEVIGQVSRNDLLEMLWLVGEKKAEVLLLLFEPDRPRPHLCTRLLMTYPELTIVALAGDDRVLVFQTEIRQTDMQVESTADLLRLIRRLTER